jgi:hypothetical protein
MDDTRVLTEGEVMEGFRSSLVVSLRVAKGQGLVGNEELAGPEEQLVICGELHERVCFILLTEYLGLALWLYYAALSSGTTSSSIPLHFPKDNDNRQTTLNDITCPRGCLRFLNRWRGIAPRIKSLSEEHIFDLACIICKKPPTTLPAQLPVPFPFDPTAEEELLAALHGISADLCTIAVGISRQTSFQSERTESLSKALALSAEDIEEAIGSNIVRSSVILIWCSLFSRKHQPVPDVIVRLSHYGYKNLGNMLDLSSCPDRPVSRGVFGNLYVGKLHDGTKIAIKTNVIQRLRHRGVGSCGLLCVYVPNFTYLQRLAYQLHTWSKCQHLNVGRLLGLAEFHGQIAMLSPWMENGDLPAYVEKYPNVDRLELVCVTI